MRDCDPNWQGRGCERPSGTVRESECERLSRPTRGCVRLSWRAHGCGANLLVRAYLSDARRVSCARCKVRKLQYKRSNPKNFTFDGGLGHRTHGGGANAEQSDHTRETPSARKVTLELFDLGIETEQMECGPRSEDSQDGGFWCVQLQLVFSAYFKNSSSPLRQSSLVVSGIVSTARPSSSHDRSSTRDTLRLSCLYLLNPPHSTMIYDVVIFIAIVFFITTIIYIIYLLWNHSIVAPPLSNAILKTWPTLTYVEAKRLDPRTVDASCCSICLVNFEEGEGEDKALRLLQECGHLFHAKCVDAWLRRRRTCPVCRSLVVNGAMQMPSIELISIEIEQS
ncbi:RING-H2 finger protein ATL70 [Dendrobium catenatum]|uniref:RING-H2 finger protein ATL70 n=1 Tax=Dendrobium catenatum TaxID=906689 RepID=A0A2I0VG29_9ASPA|nr:RING-H2 finger protein ATL70 [Dendrobium catenatum]